MATASIKKTIQINPDLFNIHSNKTRKNRGGESKSSTSLVKPIISPNILKNKLLKRIKVHKRKENDPTLEIPKYTFFKSHYWKYGATYWIPGEYDVKKESLKSIKPFKSDVFVVGESFSLKQAWMEGSLEQCELFFKTYM